MRKQIREQMRRYKGQIKWSAEDDAWIGRCPELFGGGTHGATHEEAVANLRQAIAEAIAWHFETGRALPPPMRRPARLGSALNARKRLGVSQEVFAKTLGVKVGTLRNWEQGRTTPPGPARLTLKVVETHPEIIRKLASEEAK